MMTASPSGRDAAGTGNPHIPFNKFEAGAVRVGFSLFLLRRSANRGRHELYIPKWGDIEMSVVKIIELVGESPNSWDDAMKSVIKEAQDSLRGITRIGVREFDVRMKDDQIEVFRVRAKVSFRIEK